MTTHALTLPSPGATESFAAAIGARLAPGDTLLLDGPVGAGKSHFARALIRSLQDDPEEVPSPTFTLVQTYETRAGPVWHCDLYRISGPDEVVELGLAEAFDEAICLVEWPDRLGRLAPPEALTLGFVPDPVREHVRHVTLSARGARWARRLEDLAA